LSFVSALNSGGLQWPCYGAEAPTSTLVREADFAKPCEYAALAKLKRYNRDK